MTTPTAWLPLQRAVHPPPRLRLFCFPHAGAGASIFRGWQAHLPSDVDVCPVQLPGRETRFGEPAVDRIEPLVTALTDGLAPHMNLPFAFFGYSMGSLLAFELARELRRRGRRGPEHLFVAARGGPGAPVRKPPIHHLPDAEFVRELVDMGGMPAEVSANAELLELYLPVLRADITLCEYYVSGAERALDCPISAYGGIADPDVTRADLGAWASETVANCTVRIFDGHHFFLLQRRAELLAALGADLRPVLDRIP